MAGQVTHSLVCAGKSCARPPNTFPQEEAAKSLAAIAF